MKTTAKILEVVFHILGFPLLLVLLAVASIATIQGGLGYGIPVFVGLILTAVLCIVYYVVYIILTVGEKKRREKNRNRIESAKRNGSYCPSPSDPGIRTGIILAIIAVCCLSGLWAAVDNLLPNAIADATSNTVYWEDLSDNWQARGEVHEDLLETFIKRAFYAGTLKNRTLNQYLDEGIKNEEVKKLIDDEFASIDKNGYGTYIGPSISFAQDERMTIPALVHLLLDKREPISDANGNRLDKQIPLTTFTVAYSDTDPVSIDTTLNYQYLRHNKQYRIYDENFEEVIEPLNYLVVFESNKGYEKISFLSGDASFDSFIYTIDTANGFELSCKVLNLDKVIESSTIKGTKEGYVLQKNEEDYYLFETLTEAIDGESIHYDFLLKLNEAGFVSENEIFAISAQTLLTLDDFKPVNWVGYDYLVLEKGTTLAYANWNVLDMLGEPMGFTLPLSSISSMQIPVLDVSVEKLLNDYAPSLNDVLSTASVLTEQEEVLGSKLTITLDFETGELSLVPCNVERGTLDYMKMAWLYNNGLLYVLVSLFSTRKLYLIFAAVIALTSFLIGFTHELAAKDAKTTTTKRKKGKNVSENDADINSYIDNLDS